MSDAGQVHTLKNNTEVVIRPLDPNEFEKSYRFFCNLPEGDRSYLRLDVTDPEVIKARLKPNPLGNVYRIVAEHNNMIVAEANLTWPKAGWTSHVGEIRVIIAREFRRLGLASIMYRNLFVEAARNGLEKIEAQMTSRHEAARKCVERLGFREEGVLPGFVKDSKNDTHDLIIMSVNI